MRSLNVRRLTIAVAIAVTAGVAAAGPAHALSSVAKVTPTTAPKPSATITPRVTKVAVNKSGVAKSTIKVYKDASETSQVLSYLANGQEVKGRVVFTVVETQGDWLKVNAPIRPNGTQGWIKADQVTTYTHDYYILVELGLKRVSVYKGAKLILTDKAGVGKAKTPTPIGSFYTTELVKTTKKNSPYGPFAYGISAFSEVYQTFGGGDGRVGMHGTNAANSVGGATTNGCVRLSNATITKLRTTLPLGVPIDLKA